MCGIFWYFGSRTDADSIVLEWLRKLEYRGYDSAGLAVHNGKKIDNFRSVGRVSELTRTVEESRDSLKKYSIGMGHTRWATHGGVTMENTHPHSDTARRFFVVHNGIIENYRELRAELEKDGVQMRSDTDTEIIAHLIARDTGTTLLERVEHTIERLEWAYAILVMDEKEPRDLVAVRYGSPLVLGKWANKSYTIASDANALSEETSQVTYLEDGDIVHFSGESYAIRQNGALMKRPLEKIDTSSLQIDKGAYEHFMLKEIYESSKVLTDIFRGRIDFHELKIVAEELGKFRDDTISMIEFVACGTSYHAGLLASYWIEELAVGMNTRVTIASEFFSRPPKISTDTLFVFISQSGETADSIEPLKYLRERGARTLGIVNVVGSTIARMADTTIFTRAGIEVGVASTKAFMGQTGALLLLCLYFCVHSGADYRVYRSLIAEVASLPGLAHATLLLSSEIQKIAQDFTQYSHLFFIGRGSSYAVALEGALKFKEITYAHAHAIPAGELKHGSLALIDAHCPSVIYIPNDTNYRQNLSTIEEIRARGGKVLAIAETPISIADWNIIVPSSNPYFYGIIASIASQLFAYHTAKLLGRDIDKPRNLAKSVTVK